MHGQSRGGHGCGAEWRARWGFEGFDFWGGGAGGRGPGRHFRGGRMFGHGDLRLVVLRLLDEKPRHGYDIIKELESRFGGAYAPSPGTVYPTLTLLEDLGYARVVPEEGGKKIYEITDEGRRHLAENRTAVDSIFERISEFVGAFVDAPATDLRRSWKRLSLLGLELMQRHGRDPEMMKRAAESLERAAAELETILRPAPKPADG